MIVATTALRTFSNQIRATADGQSEEVDVRTEVAITPENPLIDNTRCQAISWRQTLRIRMLKGAVFGTGHRAER